MENYDCNMRANTTGDLNGRDFNADLLIHCSSQLQCDNLTCLIFFECALWKKLNKNETSLKKLNKIFKNVKKYLSGRTPHIFYLFLLNLRNRT